MGAPSHHGQSIGIGQMRHRVRIEKRSPVQDSSGELQLTWILVAERAAALERTAGDEVFSAAGRNQRVNVVFHMRYEQVVFDVLLLAEVRISFNNRYHDVLSVFDRDNLRTYMTITCQQYVEKPL